MMRLKFSDMNVERGRISLRTNEGELPEREANQVNDHHNSELNHDQDDEEIILFNGEHIKLVKSLMSGESVSLAKSKDILFRRDYDHVNFIHRAITELTRLKSAKSLPKVVLDCIEEIILQRPDLFTTPDLNGRYPICLAAKHEVTILFRVIDLLIHPSIVEKLRKSKKGCERGQESACPLLHVSDGRLKRCLKEQGKDLSGTGRYLQGHDGPGRPGSADGITTGLQNRYGCLHGDVDVVKVLKENNDLKEVLEKALKTLALECLELLLTTNRFDAGGQGNTQVIPLDSFRTFLWLCPSEVFNRAPAKGYTPLQLAIKRYDDSSIEYGLLFSVIKSLVERCPESIFLTTPESGNKTAYRMLKELDKGRAGQKELAIKSRQDAEELFKRTCIGSREESSQRENSKIQDHMWAKKKQFLYWDMKSQQRFSFSLVGDSVILSKDYIEKMRTQSGIVFETVLESVKLPYWEREGHKLADSATKQIHQAQDDQPDREDEQGNASTKERDPYTAVFDWLWSDGVRKIFTVEVDDDGPQPHTNLAIRNALIGDGKDFEIEIWKWQKFDICCETVAIAAPAAREVHLYSHGNTAVLRGWACDSSLAKLEKLEKLVVDIYPQNASDEVDCRSYEEEFKQGIRKQCPFLRSDGISVVNHGFPPGQGGGKHGNNKLRHSDKKGWQQRKAETIPKPLEWIKRLESFKSFMTNVGRSDKLSVKVAILDDGCRVDKVEGKQVGQTFRRDNLEYCLGRCSHGTEMARCVREVCPMAELYIARLDDSRQTENQNFTIASCYEALQWALDMGVDIISMSWTFERQAKTENDEYEANFIQLIEKIVASKKVLLFGSLPDKSFGQVKNRVIPVGLDGVIRIGSATVFGETSAKNVHESPEFLLPGEDIPLSTGEIAKGSSFATAYAAGLAAIVLYCLMARQMLYDERAIPISDEMTKALPLAKTTDGMKVIFNILGQRTPKSEDKRGIFVQPYHTFGNEFSDDGDKKLQILDSIATEILPQGELRNFYT